MTLPGYEDKPVISKRALELSRNVLAEIKEHGIDSPIKSIYLEKMFELTDAEIRHIVSHARLDGEPIGSGGRGYFYARNPGQLDQTIAHLKARECKISMVREALEYLSYRLADRSASQEALKL